MSTGADAVAPSRAAWLVLAFALAAIFFWPLGAAPLFDVDEGAFAEATREMIASGDWLHTTLNGADRFDKPILVYWLQAASLLVLGKSDAAVRLPSAICGVLWCVAVARFALPRFGARAAWIAAAILGTSVGVIAIGRAATADALLNLLLALTAFDLWRHVETRAKAPLRWAALWAALGILDKGPIALLVPGGAIVVWAIVSREWKPILRAVSDPLAWLILVGIAAPWYVYALHRHGQAFVDGFVMKHNVGRFTGTLEGHAGGPFYYAIALPLIAFALDAAPDRPAAAHQAPLAGAADALARLLERLRPRLLLALGHQAAALHALRLHAAGAARRTPARRCAVARAAHRVVDDVRGDAARALRNAVDRHCDRRATCAGALPIARRDGAGAGDRLSRLGAHRRSASCGDRVATDQGRVATSDALAAGRRGRRVLPRRDGRAVVGRDLAGTGAAARRGGPTMRTPAHPQARRRTSTCRASAGICRRRRRTACRRRAGSGSIGSTA